MSFVSLFPATSRDATKAAVSFPFFRSRNYVSAHLFTYEEHTRGNGIVTEISAKRNVNMLILNYCERNFEKVLVKGNSTRRENCICLIILLNLLDEILLS